MKSRGNICGCEENPDLMKTMWDNHCPYGCNTIGFSSDQLIDHRQSCYLLHVDIWYARLKELGLDISSYKEYVSKSYLQLVVDKKLEKELPYAKNLIDEGNYLKKKVTLKRHERKEQMKLLEKSIGETSLTSFNGSYVWLTPDDRRDSDTMESPIFYTGKYGYKIQLQLVKSKDKCTQDLNLIFLKGLYDPVLAEQFDTKVTIKYQLVGKTREDLPPISVLLKRANNMELEKINRIKRLPYGNIECLQFKLDCSDFDISSID